MKLLFFAAYSGSPLERFDVIDRIQLLRNVGQFDSVSVSSQLVLSKMTLIYAENGRGKTTLAAIMRSLGSGDGKYITERRRLSATHPPHVVLNIGTPFNFQNGQWSNSYSHVAVFDDTFVAENVCSGVEIGAEHRQNLHELILGSQGVSLNANLQTHVSKIEDHNKNLKLKGEAIPAVERGALTIDAFCALKAKADLDSLIQTAERALAAAQSAEAVNEQPDFKAFSLPLFDTPSLVTLLARDLPELDSTAASRVQSHIAALGREGEAWIEQGVALVPKVAAESGKAICPFCVQDLAGSPLLSAYRSYFSEGYAALKADVNSALGEIERMHGATVPAAFERSVRMTIERRDFWKTFIEVPEFKVDTAAVARVWGAARNAVTNVLNRKKEAPLERVELTSADLEALTNYDAAVAEFAKLTESLQAVNPDIAVAKEQAAAANVSTLSADLSKLRATRARHSAATGSLCQAYLDEKAAKKVTEGLRDGAREALDTYRTNVFPAYESAINSYLQKFNAGFRLGSVTSVNNRGGSSCSYNVLINNVSVGINGSDGDPCFRNTLSAGDRNTLALAFFFASLDQNPHKAQTIVIIDDPMTSLDEHRSLTTVQETGRLIPKVRQVIVMSHSKPFLCDIWKGTDKLIRASMRIVRAGDGSTLAAWDVNKDLVTEHDRRHAAVKNYISGPLTIHGQQGIDERVIATHLRHILEAYIRVAYPEDFPPGAMLGAFHVVSEQRKGTGDEIMTAADTVELRDLLDYANKFHHETNLSYETEQINDQELLSFAARTLRFTSRR